MSWSIDRVDPEGEEWAALIAGTTHLLFHEPVWAGVLREGVAEQIECVIVREDGIARCGIMGVVVRFMGIKNGYFSYPYGGVIGEIPEGGLARHLREYGKNRGLSIVQLVGFPGEGGSDWDGFKVQEDETNVLALDGLTVESLMQSYKRVRRQEIQRAIRRGVIVTHEDTKEAIGALYSFYLETMHRTGGVARYRRELIESIVKHLVPIGKARLSVARHEGKPIGAMLVVDSETMSHGLMLVSSIENRKLEPNKLLLHTAVEDAVRTGKQGFDFMPSGQSSSGVAQFKKMWHTQQIALLHRTLDVHPVRAWVWGFAIAAAKRQPGRTLLAIARKRSR